MINISPELVFGHVLVDALWSLLLACVVSGLSHVKQVKNLLGQLFLPLRIQVAILPLRVPVIVVDVDHMVLLTGHPFKLLILVLISVLQELFEVKASLDSKLLVCRGLRGDTPLPALLFLAYLGEGPAPSAVEVEFGFVFTRARALAWRPL